MRLFAHSVHIMDVNHYGNFLASIQTFANHEKAFCGQVQEYVLSRLYVLYTMSQETFPSVVCIPLLSNDFN